MDTIKLSKEEMREAIEETKRVLSGIYVDGTMRQYRTFFDVLYKWRCALASLAALRKESELRELPAAAQETVDFQPMQDVTQSQAYRDLHNELEQVIWERDQNAEEIRILKKQLEKAEEEKAQLITRVIEAKDRERDAVRKAIIDAKFKADLAKRGF